MFGFARRSARRRLIEGLHHAVVEQSRAPALYGPGLFPDTVEGRFEALTLHVLVTMRRLRALPHPADDVAQELVDAVFAHLEIALRELGIGDMGVPKRMKSLARAFYDRTVKYEAALSARDVDALEAELAGRLGQEPGSLAGAVAAVQEAERRLSACDLDDILNGCGSSASDASLAAAVPA